MAVATNTVLALDVGAKRIGVAVASLAARLPRPLTTLDATDPSLFTVLQQLLETENAGTLVVGYPRNLQGDSTAQTAAIENFTEELKRHVTVPIHLQDEAVTSRRAETELEARGKQYDKGDIDALAASYILDDWLTDNPEVVS